MLSSIWGYPNGGQHFLDCKWKVKLWSINVVLQLGRPKWRTTFCTCRKGFINTFLSENLVPRLGHPRWGTRFCTCRERIYRCIWKSKSCPLFGSPQMGDKILPPVVKNLLTHFWSENLVPRLGRPKWKTRLCACSKKFIVTFWSENLVPHLGHPKWKTRFGRL